MELTSHRRVRSFRSIARGLCLFVLTPIVGPMPARPARAATPPRVELKVEGKAYRGKVAAVDSSACWLMGRDGRLDRLEVKRIESHHQVSPTFRSLTPVEMRDELKREFGGNHDVRASEHFVLCGPKGHVDGIVPLLEDVYRSAQRYFSVRGFSFKKPEFPLVAVIYPSRSSFAEQCRSDHVADMPGLMGYYLPQSNRVSLFDPGEIATSSLEAPSIIDPMQVFARPMSSTLPWEPPREAAKFEGLAARGTLRDTIIHETTHQVAYNTGLHPRLGETPRWVVEGLATLFEAPGVRDGGSKSGPIAQRINRERYLRFGSYARARRPARSLRAFIGQDDMLQQATLDFYCQAWALTFYLVESRPADYARYLKRLSERDPLKECTPKDRMRDFETSFSTEIERLEADFLRYMERLKVD
ncbi:MAG: DUF1570 domain-containing protein [Planctomycetaceae bacterium]|nr:DUF1570 domain-containing protein [Planctomycetaceae bacterium]